VVLFLLIPLSNPWEKVLDCGFSLGFKNRCPWWKSYDSS
jgi:hypothetical protein